MEIRGKAWRPGDLKHFYKADYICPEAYNDQAKAVEYATDKVRSELIAHSGTEKEPELYYNIPSYEYKSLIKDVREKALKEGREEAWDLARRIVTTGDGCYTIDEANKTFGNMNILTTPIDEVLAKDKEYQKEKETLHVGDEVKFTAYGITRKGYVINVVRPTLVRVLTKNLGTCPVGPEECEKTGKHNPDVEKVMASFEEEKGD